MYGNTPDDPRADRLLRVMRTLEHLRSQLDKYGRTLDDVNFLIESIRDEMRPPKGRRRPALDEKRERLKVAAAQRGAASLVTREDDGGLAVCFDGVAWVALRPSEAKLLMALARGPRGGDDGYGVFLAYDEVAPAVAPRLTRRALIQRVYRLRSVFFESGAVNPFWIETLGGVGLRLKLREPARLDL